MRSMTGFGQAAHENERYRIVVTLRGVNHRYLDISLRLREEHRHQEPALRELLAGELFRGRIEAAVDVESLQRPSMQVEVRAEVVRAVLASLEEMRRSGLLCGDLTAGDLLRLPEVLHVTVAEQVWGPEDQALLMAVTRQALQQLIESRETEGLNLIQVLEKGVAELHSVMKRLQERRQEVREALKNGLRKRLDDLLDGHNLDEGRLAQEVALLVDRSDVSEELDRLASHLSHLHEILRASGPIGRRLDFLFQEILREINTLGAKCRDAEMTQTVLDGKVLCEQLREQIQNLE